MAKRALKSSTALYPVPVVMVTCGRERPNIITLAWAGTVCSDPPMLSISVRPSRYSHHLLMQNRDFVVNIPSREQLEAADICGTVSGSKVDKFAAAHLTPLPATKVGAPLIAECPVNIECSVVHVLSLGTHDMFVARIEVVHADEEVLDARGNVDYTLARPIAYLPNNYWAIGGELAKYGFTAKRKA